jgi:hypothetical protein
LCEYKFTREKNKKQISMQGSENSSNSKREEFSYSGEEDSSDSVGYKSRVRLRQRTKKEYLKKKNI